eukprot:NODE_95_length_3313_cov_38.550551_g86_i0.p1 GENE.NODE_95_length_3313_cov_38.550551_g86_i0~~NODE_95_length_3313_cov_38.550551_g86_i0.p1  ORF type:complete len:992 (+),score=234.03 NODE_95_length_3313_cov_38.550551_g86_i0:165-3140(+)
MAEKVGLMELSEENIVMLRDKFREEIASLEGCLEEEKTAPESDAGKIEEIQIAIQQSQELLLELEEALTSFREASQLQQPLAPSQVATFAYFGFAVSDVDSEEHGREARDENNLDVDEEEDENEDDDYDYDDDDDAVPSDPRILENSFSANGAREHMLLEELEEPEDEGGSAPLPIPFRSAVPSKPHQREEESCVVAPEATARDQFLNLAISGCLTSSTPRGNPHQSDPTAPTQVVMESSASTEAPPATRASSTEVSVRKPPLSELDPNAHRPLKTQPSAKSLLTVDGSHAAKSGLPSTRRAASIEEEVSNRIEQLVQSKWEEKLADAKAEMEAKFRQEGLVSKQEMEAAVEHRVRAVLETRGTALLREMVEHRFAQKVEERVARERKEIYKEVESRVQERLGETAFSRDDLEAQVEIRSQQKVKALLPSLVDQRVEEIVELRVRERVSAQTRELMQQVAHVSAELIAAREQCRVLQNTPSEEAAQLQAELKHCQAINERQQKHIQQLQQRHVLQKGTVEVLKGKEEASRSIVESAKQMAHALQDTKLLLKQERDAQTRVTTEERAKWMQFVERHLENIEKAQSTGADDRVETLVKECERELHRLQALQDDLRSSVHHAKEVAVSVEDGLNLAEELSGPSIRYTCGDSHQDPLDVAIAEVLNSIPCSIVIEMQKLGKGEYFIDKKCSLRLVRGEVMVKRASALNGWERLSRYIADLYAPFLHPVDDSPDGLLPMAAAAAGTDRPSNAGQPLALMGAGDSDGAQLSSLLQMHQILQQQLYREQLHQAVQKQKLDWGSPPATRRSVAAGAATSTKRSAGRSASPSHPSASLLAMLSSARTPAHHHHHHHRQSNVVPDDTPADARTGNGYASLLHHSLRPTRSTSRSKPSMSKSQTTSLRGCKSNARPPAQVRKSSNPSPSASPSGSRRVSSNGSETSASVSPPTVADFGPSDLDLESLSPTLWMESPQARTQAGDLFQRTRSGSYGGVMMRRG